MSLRKFQKLWQFLIFIVFLSVLLIWFTDETDIDHETFPIEFYHDAFIDFRFSPPRLRIFTLNPCIKSNSYLVAAIGSLHLKLIGEPLEGDCPWPWAPNCYYNSYIFEARSDYFTESNLTASIDKITVILENRIVELTPKLIHPKRTDGLTVCVQPVFWYSQFQNIVFFIESWRNQGATHFIVYFHSSTKEVRQLLEYYQKIRILTIKPWPSFESLPFRFPGINSQVYRIGHTMAANICILEMNTTIGTIVDFDEVIVPKLGFPKLFEYSKALLRGPEVAALEFTLTRIQLDFSFNQSIFNSTSIASPTFIGATGPPKLIFNTTSIAIILTHSIRKFIGRTDKTVKATNGALLHYRYNGGQVIQKKKRDFKIFEENFDEHIKSMKSVMKEVYGKETPIFNPEIIVKLNECITEITANKVCRSTVTNCKSRMMDLADWVFEKSPGIFVF